MRWVRPSQFVSKKFVRCDSNDLVVVLKHEDFPAQFDVIWATPPGEQAGHDFGDFGKSQPSSFSPISNCFSWSLSLSMACRRITYPLVQWVGLGRMVARSMRLTSTA
jgi:hypothetical protein